MFLQKRPYVTSFYFPLFQHREFYFPASASKDRAVNSMEIKDFIILWTYSQWRQDLVLIPPLSPERETFCMLSFGRTFALLSFSKAKEVHHIIVISSDDYTKISVAHQSRFPSRQHTRINFPPAKRLAVHPFSPEREMRITCSRFIHT